MEKKINIAELLKDCPKGMQLDCTIYEDVYFDYVDELNIIHCYIQHEAHKTSITFNQHGTPNSDIKSKCVIFPKGKTTWEGFVPPCKFKDGDILSYQCGGFKNRTVYIYRYHKKLDTSYYVALSGGIDSTFMVNYLDGGALNAYNNTVRFAAEEEKQKLFDAIKANGYQWNAETKTLEKLIEPKFKVGNRVQNKNTNMIGTIDLIINDEYRVSLKNGGITYILFEFQDDWELIPNKFDINTLKPFDKVLVRGNVGQRWTIDFFGFMDNNKGYPFVCVGHYVTQCIPYESNEHLLGTTNDCDEYFKNW